MHQTAEQILSHGTSVKHFGKTSSLTKVELYMFIHFTLIHHIARQGTPLLAYMHYAIHLRNASTLKRKLSELRNCKTIQNETAYKSDTNFDRICALANFFSLQTIFCQ